MGKEMLITELLEKLGSFHCIKVLKPHEVWRGYYIVENISESEIDLLRKHIPFNNFSFQHFKLDNQTEIRFHIDMGKPVKEK